MDSICADLTAACERMYRRNGDVRSTVGTARAGISDRPPVVDERGYITGKMRNGKVHEYADRFWKRTDWAAIGKILDRAKVPFAENPHVETSVIGDYNFGTVAGVTIGSNFPAESPTTQIVDAASAFMDDRWTRRDELEAAAYAAALQARQDAQRPAGQAFAATLIVEQLDPSRSYSGGSAGKDLISGEPLPAGVTGIVSRYQPAAN